MAVHQAASDHSLDDILGRHSVRSAAACRVVMLHRQLSVICCSRTSHLEQSVTTWHWIHPATDI